MEEFDGIQFVRYVRHRGLLVATCCVTAMVLAGSVSVLLPARYTATASILIEPPAGNDPRGATAVSPVYLESLKTYERFASSDSVFATALYKAGLQQTFGGKSVESIKRSVLKVARPASTKIVEISATLDNPESAQRLAQYIAEQTVALNRDLENHSTQDVLGEAGKALASAGARLRQAQKTKAEVIRMEAIDALQSEVTEATQLRLGAEQELGKTRTELADMQAEMKTLHPGDGLEQQADWTSRQIEALRARAASLETQVQTLSQICSEKTNVLEARKQHREIVDAELHSANADYDVAKTKLYDAQTSAAYRGERLEIMDPGIVPHSPTFPNIPFNVMIALLVSLISSVGYLAAQFGYSRAPRYRDEHEYSLH
jgi:capsular polysaccharide biosynthesis protein